MTALTNVQAVRLRVGDTDTTAQIFSDDEVNYFLTDNSDDVLLASADALYAIAASAVLIAKIQKTGEFTIDRSKIPAALIAAADKLRAQAADAPAVAIAEINASDFQAFDIASKSDVTPAWRG